MDRQKKNSAIPILLIVAGCALYMVSGGFRHIERLQWHRRLAAVALDAGTPSLVGRRETVGCVERACTDSLAYLLVGGAGFIIGGSSQG